MEILIAEDERDIAFSYKQALQSRNHNVTITYDGQSCLEIYKRKLGEIKEEYSDSMISSNVSQDRSDDLSASKLPFDVVILDYKMPKKDGLEVAKEIFSRKPNQRIIFASAYVKSTLEDSLKYLEQVIEVLQKPFDVKALVETVEDKEIGDGLKMLMSSLKGIKKDEEAGRLDPSEEQVHGLLEGLRKIQKGRTF